MKKQFPIGAWIYHFNIDTITEKDIIDWVECGINITLSPVYDEKINKKSKMIRFLNLCKKHGVQIIVRDKRSVYDGANKNQELYRENFKKAYKDFGSHPAVYGFYLGDEPSGEELKQDLIFAHKTQLEIAPNLNPFVNFLPHSEAVLKWLDETLPNLDIKQLSYDRYSQMIVKPVENFEYVNHFYENLRLYKEIADKNGVPLWTTVLSTGHMSYLPVDEDSIKWQLNVAVALGCKAVWWFTIYDFLDQVNYRKAPINYFGERTQTYQDLSYVLRKFHLNYGDLFSNLTLEKVYCIGKEVGGFPSFKDGDSDILLSFNNHYKNDYLVSFFEDNNKTKYMAIVNNSITEVAFPNMTFAKSAGEMIRYNANPKYAKHVLTNHHDEVIIDNDNSYTLKSYLAPGQMVVYQFVK